METIDGTAPWSVKRPWKTSRMPSTAGFHARMTGALPGTGMARSYKTDRVALA
jgi:hypothetical protein